MSAKQAINDKLQGSVVTHLRCRGVVNNQIKKVLLLRVQVIFFKSVNIWRSYKQVLQAASTSASKSIQNVNSMHVVFSRIAERLKLITLSVHVCYRNDVRLQRTGIEIEQIGDECTLRVCYVTADDIGTYRCVASNVAGSAECKAQVTVYNGKLVE